jgi:hypothetical protein
MSYTYPKELAQYIWEQLDGLPPGVPSIQALEHILSVAYQASLLHDEGRLAKFRLVLCEPQAFPSLEGPPDGFHCLEFDEPRLLSPSEICQLSQAATYYRSLLGVNLGETGQAQIWGILHSGPRWIRPRHGGRGVAPALPPCLVIGVDRPGKLEVSVGSKTICVLNDGKIIHETADVMQSKWLRDSFATMRAEIMAEHHTARQKANCNWANLDPKIAGIISQHMVKRVIAALRNANQGATLLFVEPQLATELSSDNKYINLKYKFQDNEPRRRFRTLIVNMMNTLASSLGGCEGTTISELIGWQEYENSEDKIIAKLDEAIYEMAHLIVGLGSVDGALLMTQRFELLGFGGEISGRLADVTEVGMALDLEGENVLKEPVEDVGTRHRSAYRFCARLPESLAFIISQDGGARIVKYKNKLVTYWNY